jgi:hypothetical protein
MTNILRLPGDAPPIALFLDFISLPVDSVIGVLVDIHGDL